MNMPTITRKGKMYAIAVVMIMLFTIIVIPLVTLPILILVTAPLWWDS